MSFRDQVDRLIDKCLEAFGEETQPQFKPLSGSAFEISGIWDENYVSVDPGTGAEVMSAGPVIGVKVSEITDEISREPEKGDQIIKGGKSYRIKDCQLDGRGHAVLFLQELD